MKQVLAFSLCFALFGCSPVEFHEKELLSDRMMDLDADPEGRELQGHNITPREGSIGGLNSVGAGGCSCK